MNSKRPSTWWDYMPTDGGEEVKNHKWVTESELSTGIEEFVIGAVPGLLVPGTAFLFGKALWGLNVWMRAMAGVTPWTCYQGTRSVRSPVH